MSTLKSESHEAANPSPVGIIGMGLVGQALISRLQAGGFRIVGFDVSQESRDTAANQGVHVTIKRAGCRSRL
jgi:phosphoglycerate dehydrogenase-like enzyme